MKKTYTLIFALLTLSMTLWGQTQNDECIYAQFIQDVEDYCSEPFEFTNEGATPSSQIRPSCWPQGTVTNDVWYAFIPKNVGAFIQLTGQTISNEGTIDNPAIAIYSGDCNGLTEVGCNSVLFDENIIELTLTDLVIGRVYYIRVDGRDNNTGSFKLCINTYAPVKAPESDCQDAVILCNKDPFYVEVVEGVGDDTNEVGGTCVFEERASVWYKWICKDPGSLTFTITPNNPADDIDFVLYELTNGIDFCGIKRPLRCMASGEFIGSSADFNSPCFGPTGLSLDDNDVQETAGCQAGDNNFVQFIDMEQGVAYALIINNYSQSGSGFSIEWGGTGTFEGPEADFIAVPEEAFECDKTINFYNQSSSVADPIIGYTWSFGEGASPGISMLEDSIQVSYNSFGNKTAAIIVESNRGCIVTKTIDFFINPCCKDTTNLDVNGITTDLICADIEDGIIEAFGSAGAPAYQYSIDDGETLQPNPRFYNLAAGAYELTIIDSKGCEDSINLVVGSPPPLLANAGPDQEIELGESTTLNGSYTPDGDVITQWFGEGFFDSLDIFTLDPSVLPPGDYTYTLQVTDEFGCTNSDEVTIRVRIVRPVYAPNVFTPNDGNGYNDFFNLFGGPAVDAIQELLVYDRWGNLMYRGQEIEINDRTIGWDGKSNGRDVNPGVYTWAAKVRFIDDVVLPYSGDVTVIRY